MFSAYFHTKEWKTKKCANYLTILLFPHGNKILLEILQRRIELVMEKEMPVEQANGKEN